MLALLMSLWLPSAARAVEVSVPAAPAAPTTAALPAALNLPAPEAALLPAALAPAPAAPTLPALPQAAQLANPPQGGSGAPEPARAANSIFDGSRVPPAQSTVDTTPQAALRSAGPQLLARALPWRTGAQLRELHKTERAAGETFRAAVVGDSEPGRFWVWRKLFNLPGVFRQLMRKVQREPVDFIVQMGDMVSRGTRKNYEKFFETLASLGPLKPYLTVIGNHDRRRPHGVTDSLLYRSLFGPTDYWFERGGYRFVVLDSSAKRLTPDQLRWFDAALDTPLRKVVFTHIPPAQLGEWTDVPGKKGAGGFKLGAREFAAIAARRGVERVYMGHIHAFGALERDGVRYVLTGGGGSALFPSPVPDKFHHFLVLELGPDGVVETIHRSDGRRFRLDWTNR